MRGPRTSAAVLSREGRRRGQSLPQNGPGFKDAGNAKQARHPTPARGQAYPGPIPRAPASEGRSSHPSAPLAPGTPGRSPGKAETWRGSRIEPRTTTCSCSKGSWAQISRAFPSSAHFTGPAALHAELDAPSHHQSFPLGPSLTCLAQLSGSSIITAPTLSLANPEPVWCGLHLAFSILVLSARQSEGKTPTKKPPLKNFSRTTLKQPLVLLQLRP